MEIKIEQPKTRASSKCWGCCPDKIDSAHISQQTKILEEDIEIKELYVRMKSSIDEGPFHETKYQTQTQDLSYKAEIHIDVFLEFLAYHLLFFFAMGPFIVILFVKRMPLYYNLGFWSWEIGCFFQISLWLGSIFCTLVYFFTGLISDLEIGILWFSVFFRCVIASTRFATMNIDRVDTYRVIRLPEKTTKFDTVLFDWAEQTQKIQLLEIVRAIKRHDFDTSEFYINFIVPPMVETEKAINAIKIDQEDRENSYNGCKMFSYFIHSFQKQQTRRYIKIQSFLITLIIVLSSKILRLGYYDVIAEEIVINIIASLFQTLSLNCMFIYLYLSIDDLKRKYFILEQCLYLISTKRCKCQENKLTPTINFNDLKTLESWSMLRSLSFDYGANYDLRSQLYLTILLTISLLAIIFSLQMILGYFVLENTIVIPLSILVGMFFCFFLNYLIKAAMINDQFDSFQAQLENLKFIYMDIKRMRDPYFKTAQEPQSFIHRSFVLWLKDLYATDIQGIYRAIDNVIEGLEDCLRQNEYDSRNFPFKVYGIKITYGLLYSIGMGLFTVYSFAIQQRFSSK